MGCHAGASPRLTHCLVRAVPELLCHQVGRPTRTLSAVALGSWLTSSAEAIEEAMARLTGKQWQRLVGSQVRCASDRRRIAEALYAAYSISHANPIVASCRAQPHVAGRL
jgi:hypothetical protein